MRLTRSAILTNDPDRYSPDAPVVYGWRGPAPSNNPWSLDYSEAGLTATWRDARSSLCCATRPAPASSPPTLNITPLAATSHLLANPLEVAWANQRTAISSMEAAGTGDGARADVVHDAFVEVTAARNRACQEFAWAIPTAEAIAAIARHGPVVELGAGTGYWAALLKEAGVDVVCYDALPPDSKVNPYHQDAPRYHPIAPGGPEQLAGHSDRTLILCWPPYDDPMAYNALVAYKGETVIYIGEGQGGCTGDDRFHHRLARLYEPSTHVTLPTWPGIHDSLTVYRRRP